MPDEQRSGMSAAFLSTAQGRIISALTIIALLIGIVLGGIEIVTAYYSMRKIKADTVVSEVHATVASGNITFEQPAKPTSVAKGDLSQLLDMADLELSRGNYDKAYSLVRKFEDGLKDDPGYPQGFLLPPYALLARDYQTALQAAEQFLKAQPKEEPHHHCYRAHALMFLGRVDEARTVYLSQLDACKEFLRSDFTKFRKAGLVHPLMAEIERAIAIKPQ